MKFFLKILKISLAITALIISLEILFSGFEFEEFRELETWLLYFSYSFILTLINGSYFWWFEAKITWESANLRKVLLGTFGSVTLTLIGYFFCRLMHYVVYEGIPFQGFIAN
ncbi:hypothetical protein [Salegentibacter tibetensis]|uniref:hypothetical protein n=1 Tax=Salegentibacter tibetensis TaxID=2873600 RepID=UPI00293D96CD|nr:hypothetical protein [Salegentibacter tibetensis]